MDNRYLLERIDKWMELMLKEQRRQNKLLEQIGTILVAGFVVLSVFLAFQ